MLFADLPSLQFLLFYGVVCIGMLALARWYVAKADTSTALGQEPLPSTFDPFEIAYLRGGANELVRFAVFDLTRNGLLEVAVSDNKRKRWIRRTSTAPHAGIHPVCAIVYGFFEQPHTAAELFASGVPASVEAAFADDRERLAKRNLLTADAAREASHTARWTAFGVIVVLGLYRIWYAFAMQHRNIGFTIAIMVVAAILVFPITGVRRLSRRGQQYVASLRASLGGGGTAPSLESAAFPVMVAAGGLTLLAATPYADLHQTFRHEPSPNNRSTSCSGGCGSASSGGAGGGSDGGGSSCSGGGGCGGGCGG